MPTEAEIYKEVALEAIKSSWGWKVATIVLLALNIVLGLISTWADHQKMMVLREVQMEVVRNRTAIANAGRWERFLDGAQHRDEALRSCVRHHSTPLWEGYPMPPAAAKK